MEELEVRSARLMAALLEARAELAAACAKEDDAVLELAGTVRIGQGRATTQLGDATRLTTVLPEVVSALADGRVRTYGVDLLVREVRNVSDEVAAEVARRVLPRLEVGTTTDQRRALKATVLQVEAEVDAAAAEERERRARENVAVWVDPLDDGTAKVGALLDVLDARAWALSFEELVRAQGQQDKALGLKRTRNQRRAAVFAALPKQYLALLRMIAAGRADELVARAAADPEQLAALQALAASVAAEPAGPQAPAGPHDRAATSAPDDGASRPAPPGAPLATDLDLDWFDLAVASLRLPVRDPRTLNVHVPLVTALDIDQRPGWVEGVGAISPYRCRLLLHDAPLRRVVCDADTGQPLSWETTLHSPPPQEWVAELRRQAGEGLVDERLARQVATHVQETLVGLLAPAVVHDTTAAGHDPTPAQRALVELRDLGCVGPGCGMGPGRVELDHVTRYPEGPTAVWNLDGKSPRCHHAKHHGWGVDHDLDCGTAVWTSPLGRTYTVPGFWQRPLPLPVVLPDPRVALQRGGLPNDAPGSLAEATGAAPRRSRRDGKVSARHAVRGCGPVIATRSTSASDPGEPPF